VVFLWGRGLLGTCIDGTRIEESERKHAHGCVWADAALAAVITVSAVEAGCCAVE
jgi:hypothetical protein